MLKQLFIFFIIFLSINTNMHLTNAGFLDGDIGLNLYKDIEKGMTDFEDKQYKYELKGQKEGEMSKNLNKILEKKQIGACFKEGLTDKDIDKIADGDIATLKRKIKEECYDPEKKEYSQNLISTIIIESNNIRDHYKEKVKNKTKNIEEIARIGMYADGNKENSPFDLIIDLQEIDKIIFKTETIYNSDNTYDGEEKDKSEFEDLTDYLENPEKPGKDAAALKDPDNSDSEIDSNQIGTELIGSNGDINPNKLINLALADSNNFLCVNDINQSGLNQDSLDALLSTTSNNENYVFNYASGGHIKLPDSNVINFPSLSDPNFYDLLASLSGATREAEASSTYKKVNDNKNWECNQYFCIIIDFVINNFSPLSFSNGIAGKSIENILERTAKHLNKAANSSLVQHKMTKNNFEMSTRDLNLPNIFHMGIVIVNQPAPIIDLKKEKELEQKYLDKQNEKFVKDLLRERYSDLNLNYDDSNNLNRFKRVEEVFKIFEHTTGNSNTRAIKLAGEFNSIQKVKSSVSDYRTSKFSKEVNNKILSDFNKQFIELEQFTNQLLELINGGEIIITKMNKIPTNSG